MLMNHEAGEQCLLEIDGILSQFRIPHFLLQGTALGAYRDHGFVPSEKDIDIGVLQEYLTPSAVSVLLGEFLSHGFDIECFTMPFKRPRTIVAFKGYRCSDNLMHIAKADIVGLARWKNWRFTATPCRSWIDPPYAIVHESDIFEMRQSIELFGRRFEIPLQIEKYLELEYGPDWRTPADDHVSRTRRYNFLTEEGVPDDLF